MLKIPDCAEYDNLVEWCTEHAKPSEVGSRLPASVNAEIIAAVNDEMDAFLAGIEESARARALRRHRN